MHIISAARENAAFAAIDDDVRDLYADVTSPKEWHALDPAIAQYRDPQKFKANQHCNHRYPIVGNLRLWFGICLVPKKSTGIRPSPAIFDQISGVKSHLCAGVSAMIKPFSRNVSSRLSVIIWPCLNPRSVSASCKANTSRL